MKPRLRAPEPAGNAVFHHQRVLTEQPSPQMLRLARQVPIAIVGAEHHNPTVANHFQPHWPRPPPHAKAGPHFRRILPINHYRVVCRRPALPQPLSTVAITRCTRIHEDTLTEQRQLEGQGIGVRMPRKIIRANRSNIQYRHSSILFNPYVSAVGKESKALN